MRPTGGFMNTAAKILPFAWLPLLVACGGGADASPSDGAEVFPDYTPSFVVVAGASDGVDQPQDLDFHPNPERAHELWVVNKGTEDSGSEVVIIFDASDPATAIEVRQDANAWHFMNLTSALAFSPDTENFATSPEVTDANHSGGTFTGPSLWSSDLDIFAMPSGGNGSHLDMLHQSPNSMGIAHETGDAYWVFDGYANELVRYDFKEDHGPGADDHADGEVMRYSEVPISRVPNTPSHLVVDPGTGWLYIADTSNGQVLRMDVGSGSKESDLPFTNEPLAKHYQMAGEIWEVFATGLDRPCGIDLDASRLYVTDSASGEIIAYDLGTGSEIGRMATGAEAIMGVKVGPDGLLYYVDRPRDEVVRVDRG
jgi:DNA-binding beta-propeller fold protein YncE